MDCPRCNSANHVKHGIVNNKQRYLCKNCQYHYTVRERGKPKELKRMALLLYLEGLGFRSIERILKVSNVTVLNWVRRFGEELESLISDNRLEVLEMDEMHTYIGSKKTIAGYGSPLIGLEKDSSIAFLAREGLKQGKNCGIKLNRNR